MTLAPRATANITNVIQNISTVRFENFTEQWGGNSPTFNGSPNWGNIVWATVQVYPDFVGQIAWFMLFVIPFMMLWISQGEAVPAAVIGLFFGLYVFAYIGSQYQILGIAIAMVSIATVIWSIWQNRW